MSTLQQSIYAECLLSVSNDPETIREVPESFLDIKICQAAVSQNPRLVEAIPDNLMEPWFIIQLMAANPRVAYYTTRVNHYMYNLVNATYYYWDSDENLIDDISRFTREALEHQGRLIIFFELLEKVVKEQGHITHPERWMMIVGKGKTLRVLNEEELRVMNDLISLHELFRRQRYNLSPSDIVQRFRANGFYLFDGQICTPQCDGCCDCHDAWWHI